MKIKKSENNVPDVDMTPMIDIVFQLIAFFMVITNFDAAKADARVKLPVDQLAKPSKALNVKQVIINLGFVREKKTGEKLSGPLVFWQSGTQFEVEKIQPYLLNEAKYFKDTNVEVKEVLVVIRADAEFPTGLVQEVIKAAKAAEQDDMKFQKFSMRIQQQTP